jgi:hypothetical protein
MGVGRRKSRRGYKTRKETNEQMRERERERDIDMGYIHEGSATLRLPDRPMSSPDITSIGSRFA